jgi:MFS family permease
MNTDSAIKNRGWLVTISGTIVNLALGVLYAWSIFKEAIKVKVASGEFLWDLSSLNDPYSINLICIPLAMVVAGKLQDKFGPRITSVFGGILLGAGFILISQSASLAVWIIGFGIMVGAGIGFSYSATTPAALKWFPSKKTGLISGIVVSGFGLAAVYIAPLAKYLLSIWTFKNALLFFGFAFLVVVVGFSFFVTNPSKKYIEKLRGSEANINQNSASSVSGDYTLSQIIKQPTFYLLWLMFFIGAGAGLMVIGSVAGMAKKSLGESAFLVVAFLAIGNAAGRIAAGTLSDKIGRNKTLMLMFILQAILMFVSILILGASSNSILLVVLVTFIGFNYGTNFSLFPSFTKDLWGLKNLGLNYGVMFTAWGAGGAIMARFSQMLVAKTGNFRMSFIIAGVLLIAATFLTVVVEKLKKTAKLNN